MGILEHNLNFAPGLVQLPVAHLAKISGAILKLVNALTIGGADQLQNGFAQCGLAATGFAHNTQSLALVDDQIHTIHSTDYFLGAFDRKVGFQTFDGNNRLLFTHLLASSQLWQRTIWVPSSMLSSGMHSLHLSQAKSHLGSN